MHNWGLAAKRLTLHYWPIVQLKRHLLLVSFFILIGFVIRPTIVPCVTYVLIEVNMPNVVIC